MYVSLVSITVFATNRYSGFKERKSAFRFVLSKMRQHLLNALTRNIRNHFKKKKTEPKQIRVVNIGMELLCCCSVCLKPVLILFLFVIVFCYCYKFPFCYKILCCIV